mmetsp:Transcript_36552/g.81365  ORF Transcript_36552/g.81365 Transcript_36552/m.81365 type:complete len:331 (+) Transcript_36552:347-1339(+)
MKHNLRMQTLKLLPVLETTEANLHPFLTSSCPNLTVPRTLTQKKLLGKRSRASVQRPASSKMGVISRRGGRVTGRRHAKVKRPIKRQWWCRHMLHKTAARKRRGRQHHLQTCLNHRTRRPKSSNRPPHTMLQRNSRSLHRSLDKQQPKPRHSSLSLLPNLLLSSPPVRFSLQPLTSPSLPCSHQLQTRGMRARRSRSEQHPARSSSSSSLRCRRPESLMPRATQLRRYIQRSLKAILMVTRKSSSRRLHRYNNQPAAKCVQQQRLRSRARHKLRAARCPLLVAQRRASSNSPAAGRQQRELQLVLATQLLEQLPMLLSQELEVVLRDLPT